MINNVNDVRIKIVIEGDIPKEVIRKEVIKEKIKIYKLKNTEIPRATVWNK